MSDRFEHRARGFAEILSLLNLGEVTETHGLLPWGSNYTFLVNVCHRDKQSLAIYKPRRGERPLWDFPEGTLCLREVAAFVVSEALNWHIVPPTIARDGPQGYGMVQQFLEHDPQQHYFSVGAQFSDQLQIFALFDYLANNADRKGGHCLLSSQNDLWAIDHGICFHVQPKLRTVIWDFAGQAIPPELLDDLKMLLISERRSAVARDLNRLLTQAEIRALFRRADDLIKSGIYPEPGPGRQYPWPPV